MPIKNPMNLAIKLALESIRNGEVPVGCVITDSKKDQIKCLQEGFGAIREVIINGTQDVYLKK